MDQLPEKEGAPRQREEKKNKVQEGINQGKEDSKGR